MLKVKRTWDILIKVHTMTTGCASIYMQGYRPDFEITLFWNCQKAKEKEQQPNPKGVYSLLINTMSYELELVVEGKWDPGYSAATWREETSKKEKGKI